MGDPNARAHEARAHDVSAHDPAAHAPGEGSEFDTDTAVERVGDSWHAVVRDRWDVGVNPNGGYVLATIVILLGIFFRGL